MVRGILAKSVKQDKMVISAKKVFCPYCAHIPPERKLGHTMQLVYTDGTVEIVCPTCGHRRRM